MRWVRGSVVILVLVVLAGCTAALLRQPLLDSWHTVLDVGTARRPDEAEVDLVALLVGACSVMLAAASAWLLLTVAVCTGEVLLSASTRPSSSSLLRPRLVRACVATCVGATVLGSPTARAQSPAAPDAPEPERVVRAVAAAATRAPGGGVRVLEGLLAPDRTTGRMAPRSPGPPPSVADGRTAPGAPGRASSSGDLEVRPGDSLWTLTADLLPEDAALDDVATGWRQLYAANRAVVGEDPDLLRPGQSLRVPRALLDLAHPLPGTTDRRPS